jgi:hypothetical protein
VHASSFETLAAQAPRDEAKRHRRALKRDEIGLNHHRALGCCLSMTFSENRFALFRIML